MKNRFWMAAMVAVALGAGPVAAQPIVIGVSTAQTGPAAVAAEWELWGVNLAVEEINAAGGLLGGRKLEILVMDNKCNPSEAVNAANKLVEAKVVAIEGSHCSSAHLASMKIIADAKIPMVTGIASNPQITELAGPGRNEGGAQHQPRAPSRLRRKKRLTLAAGRVTVLFVPVGTCDQTGEERVSDASKARPGHAGDQESTALGPARVILSTGGMGSSR